MKRTCPIVLTLLLLSSTVPCLGQTRALGVRDEAKMFSPETVHKADERLKTLERESGWQVLIETIDSLKGDTVEARARQYGESMNVHGLVVLISKGDHKLAAEPSRAAAKVFTKARAEAIVAKLKDDFKAKQFDKGLLDAVSAIEDDARIVGVHDEAKLFSPEIVAKANATLKAVRQATKWQVVIETVDALEGQTAKERAIANGKNLNVHGLSIVISRAAITRSRSSPATRPVGHSRKTNWMRSDRRSRRIFGAKGLR